MEQRIVFVDDSESFIVRSIIKTLEGRGYNCSMVGWSVEELSAAKAEFADMVIAYIDDIDDVDAKALIYLRDICVENAYRLFFMGRREDIDKAKRDYSIRISEGEFFRPINVNDVSDQLGTLADNNPFMNRKHILVVDDSGIMLATIQEWLGGIYRVSVVNSALNAITFLSSNKPDLILLDYEMPGCSGPQLLEMLRNDEKTQNIPVMFLTGRDDKGSVESVLSLRPEGYLLKNTPKEYIVKQVNEFFEKRKNI